MSIYDTLNKEHVKRSIIQRGRFSFSREQVRERQEC